MARSRNIKPGFFTNDVLGELPALTRLLFAGIWTICDREGRLEDRPKKIRAEVLPYDQCDADEMLQSLHEAGFIKRYTAGGKSVIQVLAWAEHQNPHIKEAASTLPAPDQHHTSTVLAPVKSSPSPEQAGLIPSSLIPDSLNSDSVPDGTDGESVGQRAESKYPVEFEAVWQAYPDRPGRSKADTHKAWKARRKEGVAVEVLKAGVERYAAYCRACKTEPGFIKQPTTFFGPGEHYLAEWPLPVASAVSARPAYGMPRHAGAAAAIFDMDQPGVFNA